MIYLYRVLTAFARRVVSQQLARALDLGVAALPRLRIEPGVDRSVEGLLDSRGREYVRLPTALAVLGNVVRGCRSA